MRRRGVETEELLHTLSFGGSVFKLRDGAAAPKVLEKKGDFGPETGHFEVELLEDLQVITDEGEVVVLTLVGREEQLNCFLDRVA